MVAVCQIDEKSILPDVCGDAFELQCLKSGPAEKSRVRRSKFPEILCDVLVGIDGVTDGLLFDPGYLACCVLTDRLMRRPVDLLTILGLYSKA